MWEKEKMLVTSIFLISHSIFYLFEFKIEIIILATMNAIAFNLD